MRTVEELAGEMLLHHRGPEFKLASLDTQHMSALEAGSRVLDADVSDVEAMLRRDPAMLADLLRLANSPTYRRVGVPMNLADIIVRLGRREVYNVVMSSALRNLTRRVLSDLYKIFPERWQAVHRHFITCASTSGWLADKERWVGYDNGFMAGMFHDIGRLIALQVIAALVLRKKVDPVADAPLFDAATEMTYMPLGTTSLRAWNMPAYIVKVCECQQDPPPPDSSINKLAHGVRLVSALDVMHHDQGDPQKSAAQRFAQSRDVLQLSEQRLDELQRRFAFSRDQSKSFFAD